MASEKDIKEFDTNLAEAKKSEDTGEFFVAAHHYKIALESARNLGDSQSVTLCKNKIVEMNQKSKSEFKEFSFEQKIPNDEIDKVVNFFLEGELEEILKKIGSHPSLLPKIQQVEQSAKKTMPISYQIASISTISEEGHLLKGGSDGYHSWFMKIYGFQQGLITELCLKKVFSGLPEKGFNGEKLWAYLLKKRIFPKNNLEIIAVGLDRYFAGDYVSALHILTPQFESVFLYLSEKIGIDIVALNRGKEISTQTKTLSVDQLSSDKFQSKWGKDLCEQIKFVLFEPLGYMLRHKIAHGQIVKGECSFEMANLILYFYLVLVAKIEVNKK